MTCPLCASREPQALLHRDRLREYRLCAACDLVFVPAGEHATLAAEKARYELHRNDPSDPGYRAFLMKLAGPLMARLAPGAQGLDYGSGPAPALAILLREHGFGVTCYDPFFANDPLALEGQYDFLACCEVMEHFREPAREWEIMRRRVRPQGWIGIMTGLRDPGADFARWWYLNDFTHVAFYSRQTFRWLAARDGLHAEFPAENVILLRAGE